MSLIWRLEICAPRPSAYRLFNLLVPGNHISRQGRSLSTALDGRNRLSTFWAPTGSINSPETNKHDSSALLARAGFIRQSGSGIFHLLPLGLRVQQKIENLIDRYMQALGASKVSLSSITSEALWTKSGRFNGKNPEMYRLAGQKGPTGYLMSPTHEEEITEIAKSAVKSYRDLPLRLYQISRKYRNELRPRQGLLRAREFLMKDLYTFDVDEPSALETYKQVRAAYAAFFTDLKIPFLVAEADSGAMGGNLSHEFHFAADAGEDTVLACDACAYAVNEELIDPADAGQRIVCPRCDSGTLDPRRAVELGHTFHLGTRYSAPLGANVAPANGAPAPLQMGCHGIGVSRLIGAAASILADSKGLNWPARIAPFEVVVVAREGLEADAQRVYDALASPAGPRLDVLLDDRPERVPWRLGDADLVGYPVIVVLGKAWDAGRLCEVQCRRLGGLRQDVAEADLPEIVSSLLNRL